MEFDIEFCNFIEGVCYSLIYVKVIIKKKLKSNEIEPLKFSYFFNFLSCFWPRSKSKNCGKYSSTTFKDRKKQKLLLINYDKHAHHDGFEMTI